MPVDRSATAGRPRPPGPRSAHRPIDEALAPFADLLRQQLPTPDEIEQTAAARRRVPRTAQRTAAATAAAVAALAVLLWADPALQRQTLATAVGERSTTVLADGSEVRLNTGSRVEVAQHLRSRRLVLVAGEASFQVAHAPWHGIAAGLERPFTVQAGRAVVEDIGTVFNVRRYGEEEQVGHAGGGQGTGVAVLKGRVRVHTAAGDAPPVELAAGESLHIPPRGALPAPRPTPEAAAAAQAWRDGWLVLDATPLSAAVAEMQRHRAAPIVLADAQTAALRVSGQFHLDRLDQLIDLLPRLAPVQVLRQADGSVHIGAAAPAHRH